MIPMFDAPGDKSAFDRSKPIDPLLAGLDSHLTHSMPPLLWLFLSVTDLSWLVTMIIPS